MAPPKGWAIVSASAQTWRPRLHLCCSWRYRCGSFGGLDPGNQRDFKTRRHPLNNVRECLLPSTAFPSVWRLETPSRGNYGAFRCFSVSLSSNACDIMYCQGYNVLLIEVHKYNKLTNVQKYNITPSLSDANINIITVLQECTISQIILGAVCLTMVK